MFSDEEIRGLFGAIDTQPLSETSNRALVDPVLFRVFYATGMRLGEALNLELRDVEPARATIEVREAKNHNNPPPAAHRAPGRHPGTLCRGRPP